MRSAIIGAGSVGAAEAARGADVVVLAVPTGAAGAAGDVLGELGGIVADTVRDTGSYTMGSKHGATKRVRAASPSGQDQFNECGGIVQDSGEAAA